MNVTRVHTENSSHIEPPLDGNWDDLTKLQWKAAVTAHDTGLAVTVHEGGSLEMRQGEWEQVPGQYGVTVAGSSSASYNFDDLWTFLTGVRVGAGQAARRAVAS